MELGHAVGRGNWASIANTARTDPMLRLAVLVKVACLVRKEMKRLYCLKIVSAYNDTSFHSLLSFSWERLVLIWHYMPLFCTQLSVVVLSRRNTVIGMVIAVLLK